MKKAFLLITTILISKMTFGQEFGISISPSINNLFHSIDIIGLPNYISRSGVGIGLTYVHRPERKINLLYSLYYQHSNIKIDPFIDPNYNLPAYILTIDLLSGGLAADFRLKDSFSVNVGPTADFQLKDDPRSGSNDQTGIGLSAGIGARLKINDKIFLKLEPRIWIHNIIPIPKEPLHLKLVQVGLDIGLITRAKA
jgi:hypothetical protein